MCQGIILTCECDKSFSLRAASMWTPALSEGAQVGPMRSKTVDPVQVTSFSFRNPRFQRHSPIAQGKSLENLQQTRD